MVSTSAPRSLPFELRVLHTESHEHYRTLKRLLNKFRDFNFRYLEREIPIDRITSEINGTYPTLRMRSEPDERVFSMFEPRTRTIQAAPSKMIMGNSLTPDMIKGAGANADCTGDRCHPSCATCTSRARRLQDESKEKSRVDDLVSRVLSLSASPDKTARSDPHSLRTPICRYDSGFESDISNSPSPPHVGAPPWGRSYTGASDTPPPQHLQPGTFVNMNRAAPFDSGQNPYRSTRPVVRSATYAPEPGAGSGYFSADEVYSRGRPYTLADLAPKFS